MPSSRRDPSLNYRYDEIESVAFHLDSVHLHLDSEYNVNEIIEPDPPISISDADHRHDLIREKLQATDPGLVQLYQSLDEYGSGLRKYDAGFFWLRLPKPSNGILFICIKFPISTL